MQPVYAAVGLGLVWGNLRDWEVCVPWPMILELCMCDRPVPIPIDSANCLESHRIPDAVVVRRFMTGDSMEALTELLHRAYQPQMAMGLEPLAGRQDLKTTLSRVLNSECFLAFLQTRIVGVILLNEFEQVTIPAYFKQPGVASFSMFGVEVGMQGIGIGGQMLERCQSRSRELGYTHLALSMAEPDTLLRAYYERRGYAFVEHWQWPYTNYRSCILSKRL